jgi:hypothetical protein
MLLDFGIIDGVNRPTRCRQCGAVLPLRQVCTLWAWCSCAGEDRTSPADTRAVCRATPGGSQLGWCRATRFCRTLRAWLGSVAYEEV